MLAACTHSLPNRRCCALGRRERRASRVAAADVNRQPDAATASGSQRRAAAVAPWVCRLAAAALVLAAPAAIADEAASIFERSCAGCHTGGGNIVRRDATLRLEDLQRNGLDDPQALYDVIYSGRGSMPGFGQECGPRGKCTFAARLADDDIRKLAEFVKQNADAGWPQ